MENLLLNTDQDKILYQFITNDLCKVQFIKLIQELNRNRDAGKYDRKRAVGKIFNLANRMAGKYVHLYYKDAGEINVKELFSTGCKMRVANQIEINLRKGGFNAIK
jgi:hypothetical protein